MSIHSPSSFSFFVFFFISSIINFLLCETIYFESIHSADHLYLPLLLKDIVSGKGIGHWYFPPSPYFFPDLLIDLVLSPFIPLLYLPSLYGTVQMFFVLLGISIFISQYSTKSKSLDFLYCFEFLLLLFSLIGYGLEDKPLPFSYFFSGAHHSTGFFFSLFLTIYLYSLLNDKEKKKSKSSQLLPISLVFFFFIGFSLLYLSDRFSFAVGAISFFVVRIWNLEIPLGERISYFKEKRFWILAILFLFLNELLFLALKTTLSIPSSFQTLFTYLAKQNLTEVLALSGAYLFDFSKHIFYQGRSILILFGLVSISFTRFPKLNQHLLIVFFPVLLLLLLLVGRFTYLHPYPIRYLFPLLFFALLGLTWVLFPFLQKMNPKISLLALLSLSGILFLFPFPREKTKSKFSEITETQVPYDLEKPIRFWSEGRKTPIPVDKEGKPYHWITGAFHTHLTE
ncbi:putative membrane protein [Leptospira meyeri serovar Hardjo str. Went 5]|nr:hypothetical protein [Leptospira meyeri]EKJ85442.1 putative membrane protein [Leptospira meyeri serovar Hardjo str. Went 5]